MTSEKPVLLAGFYNSEKRTEQVLQKLEKELDRFYTIDFTKDVDFDQYSTDTEIRNEKSLDVIQMDITQLNREVRTYPFTDGHFTKQYRTFQGTCDKLLQRLDSLSVGQNSQQDGFTKEGRGQAIKEVQNIVAYINGQVHENGICCEKCELYNTMWQ